MSILKQLLFFIYFLLLSGLFLGSSHAEQGFNLIENSASPDGAYLVGWKAPPDPNFEIAETYLIRRRPTPALIPLSSKLHWVTPDQLENHESVLVRWAQDARALIVIVRGKWVSKSANLYVIDESRKLIDAGNILNLIEEGVFAQFLQDRPNLVHDSYVMSLRNAGQNKANNIVVHATLEVPKHEETAYTYEVVIGYPRNKSWVNPEIIDANIIKED